MTSSNNNAVTKKPKTKNSRIKKTGTINIVLVQDSFQVGDIKNNANKIISAATKASQEGADLVIFPELALVGYPPEDLLYRKGFLAQTKRECLRIQQSLNDCIDDTVVVFGLPVG